MKKITLLGSIIMLSVSITGCGNPCSNGHTWENATCTQPKTCSVCELTEGNPLNHSIQEYGIVSEATCTTEGSEEGICTLCGEKQIRPISKKAHTEGEWVITSPASASSQGKKSISCTVCGTEIKSESFTLSPEEIKKEYIDSCETFSYQEIARNPDSYKYKKAKFTGKVIQVMEDGDSCAYRVNVTRGAYSWSDTILVHYTRNDLSESRILEDDIVSIYGTLAGNYTYETVMGSEMTIPLIYAEYMQLN